VLEPKNVDSKPTGADEASGAAFGEIALWKN
jgi:hypothetical protein